MIMKVHGGDEMPAWALIAAVVGQRTWADLIDSHGGFVVN